MLIIVNVYTRREVQIRVCYMANYYCSRNMWVRNVHMTGFAGDAICK